MIKSLKNFVANESGATAIEYALIASLIAVFIIGSSVGSRHQAEQRVRRSQRRAQVSRRKLESFPQRAGEAPSPAFSYSLRSLGRAAGRGPRRKRTNFAARETRIADWVMAGRLARDSRFPLSAKEALPLTAFQAVVMAVLQGVTELFPISSLGHAVILPRLLGWSIDQKAPDFLPYLVVMHLGTATALFLYFWRDWFSFGGSLLARSSPRSRADRRIFLYRRSRDDPGRRRRFRLRKEARRGLRHAGDRRLLPHRQWLRPLFRRPDRRRRGRSPRPVELEGRAGDRLSRNAWR